MKLFCCHTPAHEILFRDHFLRTLPAGFEVQAESLAIAGRGDFLSDEFMACIRRKIGLILDSLRAHPGEAIVWSDVDVEFHRPVADELQALLAESGRAILFQREGHGADEVNTGFFACRCGSAAAGLFQQVASELAAHPEWNEQRAVNELLAARQFTDFGFLPMTYYARTHGWPPPRDLRIHHANFTQGADAIGQKIEQFREADRYLSGGPVSGLISCLRVGIRKSPLELARTLSRRARPRRP